MWVVPIFGIIIPFFNLPFFDIFISLFAFDILEFTAMLIEELSPEHDVVDCSSLVALAVRTLGLFVKPLVNAFKMEDMATLCKFTDDLLLLELTLAYTTAFILILLVEGAVHR